MTIGERVKELRKEMLGLTLEKFGEKLHVGKSAISDIERGRNNLSDQMLYSICREFDVNEAWLRTGEGKPFRPKGVNEEILNYFRPLEGLSDEFKRAFADALAALTEEDWKRILEMVREMRRNAQERKKTEAGRDGLTLQAAHPRTDIEIPGGVDTSDNEFFDD